MLVYVEIVHMYFEIFYTLFQTKKRPAKTKCVPAKLCAELVIAKSDSTQC